MEEKKADRRVQRTRQLLKEALLAEMQARGYYDEVSVQDITDRANLGRATFYLHYRDKEALLVACIDDLVAGFIERIQSIPPEQWALTDGAPIREVFEFAAQHERLYRVIMASREGVRVTQRLHEWIASRTSEVIGAQAAEKGLALRLPLEFLSHYYAGSLLALVFWWLEAGQPYPAEEMAGMFREISLRGRARALGLEA